MSKPLINIITRFSRDLSQLKVVVDSIREQSYKNVKHIICCESKEKIKEETELDLLENTLFVLVKKVPIHKNLMMVYQHHDYYTDYLNFDWEKCEFGDKNIEQENKDVEAIKFEKDGGWCWTFDTTGTMRCMHFPPNLYFNYAHNYIDKGWIYYIDDGDKFEDSKALDDLVKEITSHDEDTLHVFKLMNRGRAATTPQRHIMKNYYSIGHPIILNECSGSCICFHSKYKDKISWDQWRISDYRITKKLEKLVKKVNFIDRVVLYTP